MLLAGLLTIFSLIVAVPALAGDNQGHFVTHQLPEQPPLTHDDSHIDCGSQFVVRGIHFTPGQQGKVWIDEWAPGDNKGALVWDPIDYTIDGDGAWVSDPISLPTGKYKVFWQGVDGLDQEVKHKVVWVCLEEETPTPTNVPPTETPTPVPPEFMLSAQIDCNGGSWEFGPFLPADATVTVTSDSQTFATMTVTKRLDGPVSGTWKWGQDLPVACHTVLVQLKFNEDQWTWEGVMPECLVEITPTSTPVTPTATKVPPTATNVPPTATQLPPTATNTPPHNGTPTRTPTKVKPTPVPWMKCSFIELLGQLANLVAIRVHWSGGNGLQFAGFYVDWGDGSQVQFVTGTTDAAHKYAKTGSYWINVKVVDQNGGVHFGCAAKLVNVTVPKPPDPNTAINKGAHQKGGNMIFTLTATVLGAHDAYGVVAWDQLQPNMNFVSTTNGCTYDSPSRIVTCTKAFLKHGTRTKWQIVTSLNSYSSFQNCAQVSSFGTDNWPKNNVACVQVKPKQLGLADVLMSLWNGIESQVASLFAPTTVAALSP